MANSIELVERYQPMLDEVYKKNSLTTVFETDNVKFDNSKTVKILKVEVPTLGAYSRNSGFTSGDVTANWESWTLSQDRGREFSIDAMDDEETINQSFGAASEQFIRVSVTPQVDKYRFSTLASTEGISSASESLTTGSAVVSALRTGISALDEAEVPEGSVLFITPTLKGLVDDLDTTKSRKILDRFASIIEVPQSRFFDKGEYDATTEDYVKAADAVDINFMIVHPSAVEAVSKHAKLRIFTPDDNQSMDAYKFQYRLYHDIFVYENKVAGIYVSKATA